MNLSLSGEVTVELSQTGVDYASGADMPIFEGAAELIECLRLIVRRPRLREAPMGAVEPARRRRSGLPMLCLVRREDNGVLMQALARRLTGATPRRISHVVHRYPDPVSLISPAVEVSGTPARFGDADAISKTLLSLSSGLGRGANTRDGRIRFVRLGLVLWLMAQNLDVDDAESDTVLRTRLRGRDLARSRYGGMLSKGLPELADTVLPWWAKLVQLLPPLWFLVRIGGRIPGVGNEYRWLLRQPYLAPRDPGTLIGFAERLSIGQRHKEDPEQVLRLLVLAFLSDIRLAYRRPPWRPRGARRTTYPVVLLDGITRANNGYRLLRLINDVRNDTGVFDPLLVITASQAVPPDAWVPEGPHAADLIWPASRARRAYQAWCQRIPINSRARTPTAWYLPVQIPPLLSHSDAESLSHYVGAVHDLEATPPLAVAPPPFWSRRSTTSVLVSVTVVALIAGSYFGYTHHSRRIADQKEAYSRQIRTRKVAQSAQIASYEDLHCGLSPKAPDAPWLKMYGAPGHRECIGMTDGSYPFQSLTAMRDVGKAIWRQNQTAETLHKEYPLRPYVTLVYVGILSTLDSGNTTEETVWSDFEDQIWSMAGIMAAQDDQLSLNNGQSQPILRILLANGGDSMNHGIDLARMIADRRRHDPSIVGVVGLDESRDPTINTIKELGRQALPVIADELSADVLSTSSKWYFQVSPNDHREAQVGAAFIRTLAQSGRGVTAVRSNDPDDKYTSDLAADFGRAFRALDLSPKAPRTFTPESFTDPRRSPPSPAPPNAETLASRLCGTKNVIVFTGRHLDFKDFLQGIQSNCPDHPPLILAGDDVSRFVADTRARTNTQVQIPYYYLSFGVGPAGNHSKEAPYKEIQDNNLGADLFSKGDPSLDGHATLSFDAVHAYLAAVNHLIDAYPGPNPPLDSTHVYTFLQGLSYTGRSGTISFSDPAYPGVPADKAVAVLHVDNTQAKPVQVIGACNPPQGTQDPWCP